MVVQRLIKERQSPSIALCLWGFSLVGPVNTNSNQVLHSPRIIHPFNSRLERRLNIDFPANVPTWIYRPALAEASFDSLFINATSSFPMFLSRVISPPLAWDQALGAALAGHPGESSEL
jgi:hypothetical protein